MNEHLKDKIVGKLDGLSDEHGRQLMDYIDFLQSKYNRSRRAPSPFQRLAENIEDALGAGTIAEAAAKGTAQVADTAGRVVSGLIAAGRAVADELSGRPSTDDADQPQGNGASVGRPGQSEVEAVAREGRDDLRAAGPSADGPDQEAASETSVDRAAVQQERDRRA